MKKMIIIALLVLIMAAPITAEEITFDNAFEIIIMHESTYTHEPYDGGERTMYGISEVVAREYGYQGAMKDLSLYLAREIYKKQYWQSIRLDEFENDTLRLLIFDTAVNMGVSTAVKKLQRTYNVLAGNNILVDGIVGPQTLEHVNSYQHQADLKFWYCILRGERYLNIVKANPTQQRFIRGWGRRLLDMINRIDN